MGLFHGLIKDSPATFWINAGRGVKGRLGSKRPRTREGTERISEDKRTFPEEVWRVGGWLVGFGMLLTIGGNYVGAGILVGLGVLLFILGYKG